MTKQNYAILAFMGIIILVLGYKVGTREKDVVFQMCQESRATNNVSEQTCGDLQDFYGMEYLCKDRNSSTSNKCWVEVK
jgi:hypothetical protein